MENNNETERANENNANNIRNAADVAIASKHPYAVAAGGAVKVADRLTGGGASKALGSAATKLNRHNPAFQNLSNKISESGVSDAAGNVASMKNGVNGNNPETSDIGQQNLKASFASRAKNFINKRKKKKKNEQDGESNDEEKHESSDVTNSDVDDDEEDKNAKVKKKLMVKILVAVVSFMVPLMFIFMLLIAIDSVGSSIILFFENLLFMSDEKFNDEVKEGYYTALTEVANNFERKCKKDYNVDVKLDTNYIHVTMVYRFYLADVVPEALEYSSMAGLLTDRFTSEILDKYADDTKCELDYSKKGTLYNALKNNFSESMNNIMGIMYREYIKDDYTVDNLLDEIFDYAEAVSDVGKKKDDAIPDKLAVNVEDANKSVLVKDYLAGVIYASVDRSVLTSPEKLKAYTVAYTTNILSKNKISINTQSISSSSLNNFNYCDPNSKCNGKGAMSDIVKNTVNNAINSVYGNVLVNTNGDYETLSMESLNDIDGNDYMTILANAYSGYTLRNAKEDVYDNGVNYGNEQVLTDVIFYDQNDYKSSFCGLKNETIASSGCGVTSMAIIVSTYENNNKYNPVYMSEQARKNGHCRAGSGTYYGHFRQQANAFKYNYLAVRKTNDPDKLNLITSHLRKGHLIVVHVGAGHFTTTGHYMVLGGIDPKTKSVYVYDPYNRMNAKWKKSGNGWYKFSDILKEVKPAGSYIAFQIIWKD